MPPSPTPPFYHVACALILGTDGRVLAARRPLGKSLGGKWEFPGGKIEPGETAKIAIVRELAEELGIVASVHSALTAVRYDYPTFSIELHPFMVHHVSGKITAHEHSELRWIHRNEASELDWAAADIPIWQEWAAL
jgi:8-oxo-dGTP diphosphatase